MKNELEVIVKESGLDKTEAQDLLDNFTEYFEIASEWAKKASVIVVTDASQKAEMQMARTGRLFLREKRIEIDKTRKELKEQSLREGKAIDGFANILKAGIVHIEEYLGQQEKFVEIKAAAIAEQARIEMEEKAEKDILAKEEAERKEQERIRLENEKLKKEATAKEKKMQVEREETEAKRIAQETKARIEKAQIEYKAKIEKEKQDKILADQKDKARKEKEEIAKNAKKEMADYVKKAKEKEADQERKAMQAEQMRQGKLESEKKELEMLRIWVKEKIECPFCHKKFTRKNEFKMCIYCSSTNIEYDPKRELWICNFCGENWKN